MGRITLIVIIAILSLWIGGLISFYERIPDEPKAGSKNVSRETSFKTYDAIIVLTGGEKRINEGLKLLKVGHADKLFISGVYKDTRLEQVARNINFGSITLGDKARSTIGNAIETRSWIAGKNINSVLLVTANYHMPRAVSTFKREMPEVEIATHPVFPKDFSKAKWKEDLNSAKIIFFEYNKYLLSF